MPLQFVQNARRGLSLAVISVAVALTGCGGDDDDAKKKPITDLTPGTEEESSPVKEKSVVAVDAPVIPPADFDRDLLTQAMADSKIPYHPWNEATITKAKEQNKLLLIVLAGQFPTNELSKLRALDEDPGLDKAITKVCIPVLEDVRRSPELEHLAYGIVSATGKPFSYPVLIGITPGGEILTAASLQNAEQAHNVLRTFIARIGSTWVADPDLTETSSSFRRGEFNKGMKKKIAEEKAIKPTRADMRTMLNTTVTLYSAVNRNLDRSGAALSSTPYDVVVDAMRSHVALNFTSEAAKTALDGILDGMVNGAVFDPVDHLFFDGQAGREWRRPLARKSPLTNLEIATFLFNYGTSTGDERLIAFAEKTAQAIERDYLNEYGLISQDNFAFGETDSIKKAFFLTLEKLRELLDADELAFVKERFKASERGNVPLTLDATREFLRHNILGGNVEAGSVAAALGWDEAKAQNVIDSTFDKLRKHRASILPKPQNSHFSSLLQAGQYIRMLTAQAIATGDRKPLDKALAMVERINAELITDEGVFAGWKRDKTDNLSAPANAVVRYILALQDLEAITPKAGLRGQINGLFASLRDDYFEPDVRVLLEKPREKRFIKSLAVSRTMIFRDCTQALLSEAVARELAANHDLQISELESIYESRWQDVNLDYPVLYADYNRAIYKRFVDTHVDIHLSEGEATHEKIAARIRAAMRTLPSGVGISAVVDSPQKSGFTVHTGADDSTHEEFIDGVLTGLEAAIR